MTDDLVRVCLGGVLVAVGGGAGAMLRAAVDERLTRLWGRKLLSLTVINVAGSLVLGLVWAYGASVVTGRGWGAFVAMHLWAVGACGGFTTFSTVMVEVVNAGSAGRGGRALASLAAMLILSIIAFVLGIELGGSAAAH